MVVSQMPRLPRLQSFFISGGGDLAPTLDLNFLSATETLDPRITFTRASTATRVNSSGLITSVASGAPRFDYDPVTLQPRGLLIEEQRANICTASEELNLWTLTGSTVSANATTAPDGASTADKLVEDTSTGNHQCGRTLTYVTATVYTVSVYAKAGERTEFSINMSSTAFGGTSPNVRFNLSTLGVTNGNGAVGSITNAGNGWYRCVAVLPATSSGGTTQFPRFFLFNGGTASYTGDGSSGLFLWGAQVEAGAFATSYVPTTSASTATRAAETPVLIFDYLEIGTWRANFRAIPSGANRRILATTNTDGILANATGSGRLINAHPTLVWLETSNVSGADNKGIVAFDSSGRSLCLNGGTVQSDTIVFVPALTGVRLGWGTTGSIINSHLQRVTYWPARLPDSQLQVLTS